MLAFIIMAFARRVSPRLNRGRIPTGSSPGSGGGGGGGANVLEQDGTTVVFEQDGTTPVTDG